MQKAIHLAFSAGSIHREYFRKNVFVEHKRHELDLVSFVDRQVDDMLVSSIQRFFPAHSILAEESGFTQAESEFCWIVDPLDGTANFLHGLEQFGVSIALMHEDKVVVGVIYLPISNLLYYAMCGEGTHRNGKKISIPNTYGFRDGIVNIALSSRHDLRMRMLTWLSNDEKRLIGRVRSSGSSVHSLTQVAEGCAVSYVSLSDRIWDYAAGSLIVTEAGGSFFVAQLDDPHIETIVGASSQRAHHTLISLVHEGFNVSSLTQW